MFQQEFKKKYYLNIYRNKDYNIKNIIKNYFLSLILKFKKLK